MKSLLPSRYKALKDYASLNIIFICCCKILPYSSAINPQLQGDSIKSMKLLVLYYTLQNRMIKQVLEKYDYRYLVYLVKYDIDVYINKN